MLNSKLDISNCHSKHSKKNANILSYFKSWRFIRKPPKYSLMIFSRFNRNFTYSINLKLNPHKESLTNWLKTFPQSWWPTNFTFPTITFKSPLLFFFQFNLYFIFFENNSIIKRRKAKSAAAKQNGINQLTEQHARDAARNMQVSVKWKMNERREITRQIGMYFFLCFFVS